MLLDLLTLEQPRGSIRPRRIGWELFDDELRYVLNKYASILVKFRKTFSGIGTRTGSRQTHGWS